MRAHSAAGVSTMGWIYLESLIALFVLLAIVWWTMLPARKPPTGADRQPDASGEPMPPGDDP